MPMRYIHIVIFSVLVLLSSPIFAEDIVSIYGEECKPGVHKQPRGPFALHVFCDSALGTNIAVFYENLGAPLAGKYYLGKRFWQGEEWNYDVTSYSWLKENYLLLATSHIYGSGAVFKLNLEAQTYEIVKPSNQGICITQLKSVQNRLVKIGVIDCKTLKETIIEIAL